MANVTRTEYKLEEARFFLKHLEEHWRHVPNVDFYLSAFVSAARSVTWVMKSEFGKVPGWEEWYDARKPSQEVRALLKQMNDIRVRSTKAIPIRTRTTAKVNIRPEHVTPELMELLQNEGKDLVNLEPVDAGNTNFLVKHGDRVLARAYLEKAEHELPEFAGKASKDICRMYLQELESLVKECWERFHL